MLKRKICMVGDFAVGKTSITQRFVNNIFSDKYLTTIGVKIDSVVHRDSKLIVWDVAGRDSLSPINSNYLVGAAGIVLVADGTRPQTVDALESLWQTVVERIDEVPVIIALNKYDHPDWQITDEQQNIFRNNDWDTFNTSAKEDSGIASMFDALADKFT